jgi:hypothetical protein
MTARRPARPTARPRGARPPIALALHFDFGIAEAAPIGFRDEDLYFVRFVCGCVGVVARGRMIRRAGGLALVCAHVAAD